ncbi:MAG TPA: hypothetical protein VKT51_07680 [Candidatus Eremiobacteraceae bacterium]|nr:hypothetical protein [Candidatus Eremiobacteraceae bacterium]
MEFLTNLVHTAAWVFGIVFVFALIGLIATIRWLIGLFTGAEQAVSSGVESVERGIERR